jgi:hypothetical protein
MTWLLSRTGIQSSIDSFTARLNTFDPPTREYGLCERTSQGTQVLLSLLYQDRLARGADLPALEEVEFRVSSQNGEDGILLFLFSVLGAPTKRCVEMCVGNGIECNTANLVVSHGWRGLMIDGDASNIERGKQYYDHNQDTSWFPPSLVHAWVTAETVNDLITGYGFDGAIDLLSLDLDGVDYWIWKALTVVRPRVVVVEYNWTWGPDETEVVPYAPDFKIPSYEWKPAGDNMYFGASLAAFTQLAREKGYRLIGCQRWGFNAFFVQEGLGEEALPTVTPKQCFDSPVMRDRWNADDFLPLLRTWDWVSV